MRGVGEMVQEWSILDMYYCLSTIALFCVLPTTKLRMCKLINIFVAVGRILTVCVYRPLPLFCWQAYKNQIQGMAVSYKRLVALGSGLASNPYVENRNVFTEELKDLEAKWEPLKDNVMDTLDLLVRWVWSL